MKDNGASGHRFLQGNSTGLEELVSSYGDSLVRFAYCFLGDSFTAEDVMEDAFVALIAKRKTFETIAQCKAYLFQIARNRCIDILRARKHTMPLKDDILNVLDSSTPDDEVCFSDRNKVLYRCIQTLPEGYRGVLDLVYFEGFSVAETAKILHKSNKQVYNLLSRAKSQLKQTLITAGIDDENF